MLAAVLRAITAPLASVLTTKPPARRNGLGYTAEMLHHLAARATLIQARARGSSLCILLTFFGSDLAQVSAPPKLCPSPGCAFLSTKSREKHQLLAKMPRHIPKIDLED